MTVCQRSRSRFIPGARAVTLPSAWRGGEVFVGSDPRRGGEASE
jgi:hypothetical protein